MPIEDAIRAWTDQWAMVVKRQDYTRDQKVSGLLCRLIFNYTLCLLLQITYMERTERIICKQSNMRETFTHI